MKDRDDPRAALSVAVVAGRVAAIAAASVLSGQLPPAFVTLGLAAAICLSLTRRTGYIWVLVALDLTLALAFGLTNDASTLSRIAIAGAAAQAGAALGVPGAVSALPTAMVAWWAPIGGVLLAGLGRLWREADGPPGPRRAGRRHRRTRTAGPGDARLAQQDHRRHRARCRRAAPHARRTGSRHPAGAHPAGRLADRRSRRPRPHRRVAHSGRVSAGRGPAADLS